MSNYSKHLDQWHGEESNHTRFLRRFYAQLFATHLLANKHEEILEIGTGTGVALRSLIQAGYQKAVGVDIDPDLVGICTSQNLPVVQVIDTIKFLNTKPQAYAAILLFDVLEHIPVAEQAAFLEAILFALKPNGQIILTTPNANSIVGSRYRYIDYTHHCSFTETSLQFLMDSVGFQQISITASEGVLFPKTLNPFQLIRWSMLKCFRASRRLHLFAEIGPDAFHIPLSPNLFAKAIKQ